MKVEERQSRIWCYPCHVPPVPIVELYICLNTSLGRKHVHLGFHLGCPCCLLTLLVHLHFLLVVKENELTSYCVPKPSGNRYNKWLESVRQGMSTFTLSSSHFFFYLGEDVSTTQTATYQPHISKCVWTNVNLAKEFVKVKTYPDLLVLRQDVNDNLAEPGWCMRCISTNRHIQMWTSQEKINGLTCTQWLIDPTWRKLCSRWYRGIVFLWWFF